MGFAGQEYWSGLPLPSPAWSLASLNLDESQFSLSKPEGMELMLFRVPPRISMLPLPFHLVFISYRSHNKAMISYTG